MLIIDLFFFQAREEQVKEKIETFFKDPIFSQLGFCKRKNLDNKSLLKVWIFLSYLEYLFLLTGKIQRNIQVSKKEKQLKTSQAYGIQKKISCQLQEDLREKKY